VELQAAIYFSLKMLLAANSMSVKISAHPLPSCVMVVGCDVAASNISNLIPHVTLNQRSTSYSLLSYTKYLKVLLFLSPTGNFLDGEVRFTVNLSKPRERYKSSTTKLKLKRKQRILHKSFYGIGFSSWKSLRVLLGSNLSFMYSSRFFKKGYKLNIASALFIKQRSMLLDVTNPSHLWVSAIGLNEPTLFLNYFCLYASLGSMFLHRKLTRQILSMAALSSSSGLHALFGIRFLIVGKIAVGGNSRTRTMQYQRGLNSLSRLVVFTRSASNIVWTITGCLGIHLSFYF
jgi:hypothetical protein